MYNKITYGYKTEEEIQILSNWKIDVLEQIKKGDFPKCINFNTNISKTLPHMNENLINLKYENSYGWMQKT